MLRSLAAMMVVMMSGTGSSGNVQIRTKDSLSLQTGVYASVQFAAEPVRHADNDLPLQYHFTESGDIPPGMKFEPYPCNKPGLAVCSQLASSNGVFLDGTPSEAGTYKFVVKADGEGRSGSQEFTVTVK